MADLIYGESLLYECQGHKGQMIRTYQETGSISAAARIPHTTRATVRKWGRRYGGSKLAWWTAFMVPTASLVRYPG